MPTAALRSALTTLLEAANRRARDRALAPLESQLEAAAETYFRAQGSSFLRAFSGKFKGRMRRETLSEAERDPFAGWEALLVAASSVPRKRFVAALDRLIRRGVTAGAEFGEKELARAASGLELTFSLKNPRAVKFLKDYGADRVTMIDDTTRDRLRRLLANAAEGGWSYDRLAKQIRERFTGFDAPKPQAHIRTRAHLVAVTEAGEAFESGHRMVADELADSIPMQHAWLTAGDDRVTPECRANGAQGWIDLGKSFSSGNDQPLRFPGCRCAAIYRRKPGKRRG